MSTMTSRVAGCSSCSCSPRPAANRSRSPCQKAQEILGGGSFKREPVYAEVPQKVWWTPQAPKDDYDEKAVRTLRNLERAGLVDVTETLTAGTSERTSPR